MNQTARITRLNSEASVFSATQDMDDLQLESNVFTVLQEIHMYLCKVIIDGGIPKTSTSLLKKIKNKLPILQTEFTKIVQESAYLSGKANEASNRADEYHHLLNNLAVRLTTKKTIEDAMEKHLSHIQNIQEEMHTLKEKITDITTQAQKSSINIQPSTSTHQHQEQTHTKVQPVPAENEEDDIILKHRRTIIMRNRTAPYKTGKDIRTHLCSLNIACPVSKIENIYTKRNHLEIICKTHEHKETIIRELQTHQELNRTYNFTTKSIQKQKMVLLDVPDNYTNEEITTSITLKYYAHKEDIIHLKQYKLKDTGCSNRILVIPIPLAKEIIQSGGLPIGFKKCKLSPYTQITRCRNCHSLTHNERTCPNTTKCERCGGPHQATICKATEPLCINCTKSNQNRSTKYTTNHTASDRNCHSYRNAYSQEREKLNNIFYTSTSYNAPPPLDINNYPSPPHSNQDYQMQPPGPEARRTGDSSLNYWYSRPPYPGNPWRYSNYFY